MPGSDACEIGHVQNGVVATVRTDQEHSTAWQRFLPRGPLALLPARNGYSSIVWTTTPKRAKELTEASSVGFALAANEVSASRTRSLTEPA